MRFGFAAAIGCLIQWRTSVPIESEALVTHRPIFALAMYVCWSTLAVADESKKSASLQSSATPAPIMKYLADELDYSMANLTNEDGTKPYYINYTVYDEYRSIVSASLGAITQNDVSHDRNLNIELRVGDYSLDNTRQLREAGPSRQMGSGNIALALDDESYSIAHALWYNTDELFKSAAKRLTQIKTNLKIKVEEEDKSDDFSREEPHVYYETPVKLEFDNEGWAARMRKISAIARDFPLIYSSNVNVAGYAMTRYMVTSEGARLQTVEQRYRVTMSAATKAEDGMELNQFSDFNSSTKEGLPTDPQIETAFRDVIEQVLALREAPLAEPFIGPAILRNRASGVFFHEIFGHRIEGHRQKDVTEGQTFTKKIGQPVLPEFISVVDDPTAAKQGDIDLRGFYLFDDEGVKSFPVRLVEDGVLKTFLLSRSPVENFPKSNGHGRRQPGRAVVSRQGNLTVESKKKIKFDALREKLKEEASAQGKPYGLLFEDISGGFTTTSNRGPQAFTVLPIVVYRVYVDGRPDELIRGANLVGTPLTSFEKIMWTGDDTGVFNGSCGAESGWVPVSAVSPSILVSTIEIEKRSRAQSRPPILPAPLSETH